jgi:hypothetical protein
MNKEPARKAADKLYARMIKQVIRAIGPFIGLPSDSSTLKQIAEATYATIVAARKSVQHIAYQDYISVVGGQDPVPKLELKRFTPELWQGVVDSAAADFEHVAPSVAEEIGMQGDRWTRDAEWGTRLDVANNDARIRGWARVDFEPPTCPWCTVMNSRGPTFHTAETGAATLHIGDTCTLVLVLKGQDKYPGIEHTDAAMARYKQATKAVGTNPTDVFRFLKEEDLSRGVKPRDGKVRRNAKDAVQQSSADQLRAVKARIKTLENLNPKSESAKKYKTEQLARNQKQLSLLESGTHG